MTMLRMLRVTVGLAFVLGISVQLPAAQDLYLGTWTLDANSVNGHIPGLRPETRLVLARSDGELSVTKDGDVPEIYSDDGSASALPTHRTGRVLRRDNELVFTTVRIRPGGPSLTIVNDRYRAVGSALVIERTLRVILPDGGIADTPQNRWEATYRRD
jgi:hypothetical protein